MSLLLPSSRKCSICQRDFGTKSVSFAFLGRTSILEMRVPVQTTCTSFQCYQYSVCPKRRTVCVATCHQVDLSPNKAKQKKIAMENGAPDFYNGRSYRSKTGPYPAVKGPRYFGIQQFSGPYKSKDLKGQGYVMLIFYLQAKTATTNDNGIAYRCF